MKGVMTRLHPSLRIAQIATFGAASILFTAASALAQSSPEPVRTIAGSGALGMRDGPAAQASFLAPTSVARGSDGTIFISDAAAQRIRALKDGTVSTVAGSGTLGKLGMSVPGGDKDGPALSAQFNEPMGIAVGPDGALYIADARNKKIRKLHHGVVTTMLSGLESPRAVAFDRSGNLWIADYGGGLKRWDGHALSTTPLPGLDDGKVLSVSASPDSDDPTVLAVAPLAVYEYHVKAGSSSTIMLADSGIPREYGASNELGTPRQVASLGNHQAIYTDPVGNSVRYLRFAVPPFIGVTYTAPIAGGQNRDGIANAGFHDGADARFDRPSGLFVHEGAAIVADTGNRRIRMLMLPHFRTPQYGFDGVQSYDDSHYEVALVGPSTAFWNSHDDSDSICGAIERVLNAQHAFSKPVRCHSNRIDAGLWPRIDDYIKGYLSFRHVDAYVILMHPYTIGSALPSPETVAAFRSSVMSLLAQTHAQLLFVWWADRYQVSDTEDLDDAEHDFLPIFPEDVAVFEETLTQLISPAISGLSRVSQYDLFPDVLKYERTQSQPFYDLIFHPTPVANNFIGSHIAAALLRFVPATAR